MLKTFKTSKKRLQWISMNDWKPNVSAPIWHQKTQPFQFETKKGQIDKTTISYYHTNLTNIFKYVYTIKQLKI